MISSLDIFGKKFIEYKDFRVHSFSTKIVPIWRVYRDVDRVFAIFSVVKNPVYCFSSFFDPMLTQIASRSEIPPVFLAFIYVVYVQTQYLYIAARKIHRFGKFQSAHPQYDASRSTADVFRGASGFFGNAREITGAREKARKIEDGSAERFFSD